MFVWIYTLDTRHLGHYTVLEYSGETSLFPEVLVAEILCLENLEMFLNLIGLKTRGNILLYVKITYS